MEFLVQDILRDSDSDDDVSALSGLDSDILEKVEKADFVEFLDDNTGSSMLAGTEQRPILSNFWKTISQCWLGLQAI
jgi:hypothetical protein